MTNTELHKEMLLIRFGDYIGKQFDKSCCESGINKLLKKSRWSAPIMMGVSRMVGGLLTPLFFRLFKGLHRFNKRIVF